MLATVHDPVNQQVVPMAIGQANHRGIGMIHEPGLPAGGTAELAKSITSQHRIEHAGALIVQGPQHQSIPFAAQGIGHQVRRAVGGPVDRHRCLALGFGNLEDPLPLRSVDRSPDPQHVLVIGLVGKPGREEQRTVDVPDQRRLDWHKPHRDPVDHLRLRCLGVGDHRMELDRSPTPVLAPPPRHANGVWLGKPHSRVSGRGRHRHQQVIPIGNPHPQAGAVDLPFRSGHPKRIGLGERFHAGHRQLLAVKCQVLDLGCPYHAPGLLALVVVPVALHRKVQGLAQPDTCPGKRMRAAIGTPGTKGNKAPFHAVLEHDPRLAGDPIGVFCRPRHRHRFGPSDLRGIVKYHGVHAGFEIPHRKPLGPQVAE